jgi:adhesin transport system membrane fusion protein
MSDDTEFMSELEAATRMKASFASNLMLFSITGLIVLFIIWASVSRIEEITRGNGQVVPSQEIQTVQSLEGGILSELLVVEGDRVTKDQVLLRISDVLFASEERGVEARFAGLRAKQLRLEAESNGTEFTLPEELYEQIPKISDNEKALYKSRQQELSNALSMLDNKISAAKAEINETYADMKRMRDSSALLQQELDITKKMVEQKAVPKLEEIRLQRELSDISGQLRADNQKLVGLKAELSAAEKEKEDQNDKFRSQALGELSDVETEIKQLEENLKSIGDRVYRTELRAPVDGIVNKITLKTIGGVVEPAHKLVEIVPIDDELKIIAKVRPSDIAFLDIGQNVKVKISAYDPQRYGSLEGKLVRIGANSVKDNEGNIFFEIEVRTEKNYMGSEDNPLPITPGMVAETEVITGKRTIMEYLMKPILRAKDRALTER